MQQISAHDRCAMQDAKVDRRHRAEVTHRMIAVPVGSRAVR